MFRFWPVVCWICIRAFSLYAQTPIYAPQGLSGQIIRAENVLLFEDAEGRISIEQAHKIPFHKHEKESFAFGFTHSAYWFKIKVLGSDSQQTYLEIGYGLADKVELFWLDKQGNWQVMVSGDQIPFSQRPVRHRFIVFPLQNPAGEYLLRVKTSGSLIMPMKVHNPTSLRLSQVREESFMMFFYGVMVVMIAYNLMLFFGLRDKNYLLYCIGIFFNVFGQAALSGHTLYIWGDYVWWVNRSIAVLILLFFSSISVFSISFLNLPKYAPLASRILVGFSLLALVFAGLSLIIPYAKIIKVIGSVVILFALVLLIVGAYVWAMGRTSARFFVLAWTVYFVGAIMQAIRNFGWLDDNFWTRHTVTIGSVMEVVLISFALADRINIYRREKEAAQKQALEASEELIRLTKAQNEILNTKVAERTNELREANEELLQLNEELQQTQEELLSKQETIEQANKELSYYRYKMESSIRAANLIQQSILPQKSKMDTMFSEWFVLNLPRDGVSGDFYWVYQQNDFNFLAVVDCTGHGVPGAFMTMVAKTLLDRVVGTLQRTQPDQILSTLHRELQNTLQQRETHNNDGLDIALCAWQTIGNEIRLRFSGAKRPIYLYRNGYLEKIPGSRRSIGGILDETKTFEMREFVIPKNSATIYLATDGFSDQNCLNGRKITEQGFTSLLSKVACEPLTAQREILLEALEIYKGNVEQRDDILVLGVRL